MIPRSAAYEFCLDSAGVYLSFVVRSSLVFLSCMTECACLMFTVGSTRMEDPNAPGARDTTTMTELEKKGHLISQCFIFLLSFVSFHRSLCS